MGASMGWPDLLARGGGAGMHWHFISRQLRSSRPQVLAFIFCVALSMLTLVSLAGFRQSVQASLRHDARQLLAGDLALSSQTEFTAPLTQLVANLVAQGRVQEARLYELYSVVRDPLSTNSLLAKIKIAEPAYPFYGEVALASGGRLSEVLTSGKVIVEQPLLDRLGVKVGAQLQIGALTLTIADIVQSEPDRPASFFSLGPRVFVAFADLEGLGLVGQASRVEHKILLRVAAEKELPGLMVALTAQADPAQETVATYQTAESGVRRFFDNLLFFLSLIGIFTLLLAGIGMQSALTAFLREKEKTIAVVKAMGGTGGFILSHFLVIVGLVGGGGIVLGLLGSLLLQLWFPTLFSGLLPGPFTFTVTGWAVGQGIALGTVAVGLFSIIPLYRLQSIKPNAILRQEPLARSHGLRVYLGSFAIVLLVAVLVLWQLNDIEFGLYFLVGVSLLVVGIALATRVLLWGVRRLPVRALVWRLAVKGLFRPHNATQPIVLTLGAALSLIFSLSLIEQNLDAAFVQSYPPEVPNLFFLDIQPGQQTEFARILGRPALYYPVVRARVKAINGQTIDRRQEQRHRRDNMGREFNLTYRDFLLADETLVKGKTLFRSDWQGPQVSLLDTVVGMKPVAIGDTITFAIQGVPLQARVASIRSRIKAGPTPFFYYVFPPEVLKTAPQTFFAAVRVEKKEIGALQSTMVAKFPNVSVVDMSETTAVFGRILHKLSSIVRFFTLFSMAAGILILLSAILATRLARIREAVYYKLLGARRGFVVQVFALEHLLLAAMSSGLALAISEAVSYLICVRRLDIGYNPRFGVMIPEVLATLLLVVLVGLVASRAILAQRPAAFLLRESEE